jgi:hypothetical protein
MNIATVTQLAANGKYEEALAAVDSMVSSNPECACLLVHKTWYSIGRRSVSIRSRNVSAPSASAFLTDFLVATAQLFHLRPSQLLARAERLYLKHHS